MLVVPHPVVSIYSDGLLDLASEARKVRIINSTPAKIGRCLIGDTVT